MLREKEPVYIVLVGLISDTHGLLRPRALELLENCEVILHAGDVGDAAILAALRQIAPVFAVRGNIDRSAPLSLLPMTVAVTAGSKQIHMLHNISELDLDPASAGFDVVVFGHSHKREQYVKEGVTYINPGSAGPRRFRLPIGLARLESEREPIQCEFLFIEV